MGEPLRCRVFGHRCEYVFGETDQQIIAECRRGACEYSAVLTDTDGQPREDWADD